MIRSLAIPIAALFALVSIDAVAAEEPPESSPPSVSKGSKKSHAKGSKKSHAKGSKKAAAKAGAKKAPPAKADPYQATLEKMRDVQFSLEGLRHLDRRPTDFQQSELVGGIQGEKEKVTKVMARARKFAASQKFRHLIAIRDDEALAFAQKLKARESLAEANGWTTD